MLHAVADADCLLVRVRAQLGRWIDQERGRYGRPGSGPGTVERQAVHMHNRVSYVDEEAVHSKAQKRDQENMKTI